MNSGHKNDGALQAGAGVVYDSDPTREYEETLDKLKALEGAVEIAEQEELGPDLALSAKVRGRRPQ